jgi:MFS family permease
MSSQDYATALSVYFVSYNLFEVPSNLLLKKLRPRVWLPSIVIAWSIVMTLMGVVQNKGGLYATRFLLGVTESGLFPGVIFYLSLWVRATRPALPPSALASLSADACPP